MLLVDSELVEFEDPPKRGFRLLDHILRIFKNNSCLVTGGCSGINLRTALAVGTSHIKPHAGAKR